MYLPNKVDMAETLQRTLRVVLNRHEFFVKVKGRRA